MMIVLALIRVGPFFLLLWINKACGFILAMMLKLYFGKSANTQSVLKTQIQLTDYLNNKHIDIQQFSKITTFRSVVYILVNQIQKI